MPLVLPQPFPCFTSNLVVESCTYYLLKLFFPLPYLHNLQMLTSRTISLKKNAKPMIEHLSFSIAFQSLVNKKMLSNFFLKIKVTWGYLMNQKIERSVHWTLHRLIHGHRFPVQGHQSFHFHETAYLHVPHLHVPVRVTNWFRGNRAD